MELFHQIQLQEATDDRLAELKRWISATEYEEEEKIRAVTRLYTEIGVDGIAVARINAFYSEAQACLAKVNLPEERKQVLWQYAQSMLGRSV